MLIKKIVFFVFIAFFLFVINELTHSVYNLWKKHDLIDETRRTLIAEKKKNIELKKMLGEVGQQSFIEKEARNKLFLVKPGERIVVVEPTTFILASPSSKAKPIEGQPNWKQWWETFFKT